MSMAYHSTYLRFECFTFFWLFCTRRRKKVKLLRVAETESARFKVDRSFGFLKPNNWSRRKWKPEKARSGELNHTYHRMSGLLFGLRSQKRQGRAESEKLKSMTVRNKASEFNWALHVLPISLWHHPDLVSRTDFFWKFKFLLEVLQWSTRI